MRKVLFTVLLIALISVALSYSIAFAQVTSNGTYDDPHVAVQCTGTWSAVSGGTYANAMFGTLHRTQDPNATARFSFHINTFSATTITIFYTAAYNHGRIRVLIDNSLPIGGIIDTQLSEARRQVGKTFNVTPGVPHTITVKPDCTRLIDIDAFAVNIASYSIQTYDDNHSALTSRYFGQWTSANVSNGAYLNTIHYSDTPGSLVHFTFVGSQVRFVFSRAPDRGTALITIDGIDKGDIVQYSSDSSYPRQFSKAYRDLGVHIITITVSSSKHASSSGNRVDIDALDVPNRPGDIQKCRACARVKREFRNDYTAFQGYLTHATPVLRDSTAQGSFSLGVIWIDDRKSDKGSYFEGGWRKEILSDNLPHTLIYFGYYAFGSGFNGFIFEPIQSTSHRIVVTRPAGQQGCYWHIFTNTSRFINENSPSIIHGTFIL